MEGLENHPTAATLRLMRFGFEPNQPLVDKTAQFVQESHRVTTPLRFYASRQLLMRMPDFYRHEGNLETINKNFKAFKKPIHIAQNIVHREIDAHTTRFRFLTTNQIDFDTLTSLSVHPDDRKVDSFGSYKNPTSDQLPNQIENQPMNGHYLFVDIATKVLAKESERRRATVAFNQRAAGGAFFVHTSAISTVKDIFVTSQSPYLAPVESLTDHMPDPETIDDGDELSIAG